MEPLSSTSGYRGRIICYGDSNTFGHDPCSYIGNQYPPDQRWTGRLVQMGWDTENLGLNGRQIPVGESELQTAAAQIRAHLPADTVLVMLGTNDLLWNPTFRAEDAAARMENFLLRLLPVVGRSAFLLLSPPLMQSGSWVTESRLTIESGRLGMLYAAVAERHGIAFADAAAWNLEIAFDGVHLSEAGHRRFAEMLDAVLQQRHPI